MVVLSVAVPASFLPLISTVFGPSVRPIFIEIIPSSVKEKLLVPVPLILRVISFHEPTFSVRALILKVLSCTVTGDGGLMNLISGRGGLMGLT